MECYKNTMKNEHGLTEKIEGTFMKYLSNVFLEQHKLKLQSTSKYLS